MNESQTFLVSLLLAIPGILALGLQFFRDRTEARKTKSTVEKDESEVAETYKTMASQQAEEIKCLTKEYRTLEKRCDDLDETIAELRKGIKVLITQLKKHNITPDWEPSNSVAD